MLGLGLAYFQYRKDLPATISSIFYPILGDKIYSPMRKTIDILAVFITAIGVASTLGLSALQITGGLNFSYGIPNTTTFQVNVIVTATVLFLISALSGLNRDFGHLMEEFYPHIMQLTHESHFIYDRASRLTDKDTLILVANAPYTTQSVKVAKFLHKRGVSIILITDLPSCPAASYSSIVLNTKSSEKQYTILPAIALLESLVIEFG
ncbi:MurR/RpiR family transcriptional regulator [Halobacillus sp. A1]|uniref:MurR/RpiR family transcriptional regulator n=1 Tax=Halobacillus sp. A1 TaxID=2880262 RepID=UPI0020A6A89C|nr:BCCT family transporter [Halobacillus sp. A1]